MNKKMLGLLQYLLFFGLAIFLVWWSLGKIEHHDWLEIRGAWGRADFWLLIPVILVLLGAHLSRAARWRILMEPMGYYPSLLNTFFAVLISYIVNLFVPRLGEVIKCTILTRYEHIPTDRLVGTVVAERAFDLVCLAILFALTFVTQLDVIGNYGLSILRKIFHTGAGTGATIINWTLTIIIILAIIAALRMIFSRLGHIRVIAKVKEVVRNIWYGLGTIRHLKHKGWFIFHTVLIWVLYLAAIRVGMAAMKETDQFGIKESLSVLCMGSVGMIAAPGGIGAYPFAVQKTMMLYGMSMNMGKAFGWLLWLVQFFMVIFFGALSLLLLPLLNRKKQV
jgi:uncharacterized protein (TIRG00374 family)